MSRDIYFDNSATTPIDPAVAQAMDPWIDEYFGNPSSMHRIGRQAREAVELARHQVAQLINAKAEEILFTGSGTEADNTAIVGLFELAGGQPFHLITSAIEHPAILETCRYLERRGAEVTYLSVDSSGMVDPEELASAFEPHTRLVSIMTANNVVGTIQPIAELARITRDHGALFHTDAVQAAGRIPLDVHVQPIDLLSLSAHKIYGPKGCGALYVRQGIKLEPLLHGGGQELGRRSATENVIGIVGFGVAADIARVEMSRESARLVQLRDRLIRGIVDTIPNAYLIGHPFRRLPGHICIGFAGQEGEAIKMLLALDQEGIAISSGSACSSNHATEASYVLKAMGFDPLRARGGLRITLGRFNTEKEVNEFLEVIPRVVDSMRTITSRAV
ncbi:aminotransferase class V-fold PLP-dependent enzyme [Heliobacillus mobilis]|uniref:cysteine desulfurase n=1 Tax=Heliobacterium mobile TaxID=28064 RepID=A0A6I3SHC0_HELMO|nr:cysteine desulfurase family protein [Heliobacterium mobile]MTV48263.1 aminotransferase class V-fold PLP-dependent enzyme [Heliobacterium mobile]